MFVTKMKNLAEICEIHKAIEFAERSHEGQNRKGTLVPYIVHPFEVAQILIDAGSDTKVIIAGLLHDTVEDTVVSINDIQEKFGLEVASLVSFCSEDKREPGKNVKVILSTF